MAAEFRLLPDPQQYVGETPDIAARVCLAKSALLNSKEKPLRPSQIRLVVVLAAASLVASSAAAQPVYYPAKGQSHKRQNSDLRACHQWAVQQTGFDPALAQAPPQSTGGVAKGALAGGAVGGVAGSFNANAGRGALAGAAVGGLIGGVRQNNQNARANEREAQNMDAFNRALGACMSGRGYTVR